MAHPVTPRRVPVSKRLLDLLLAVPALVILSPVMAATALIILIKEGRPVLFRQQRPGRGGKLFTLNKFRTMRNAVDRQGRPLPDEQRLSRFGRTLRSTSIDELPELFNVLRGEMSIIGPRPERPEFVEQLARALPFYRARHALRPGITGWAQVQFDYGNSLQDALVKLEYDLFYIKHASLLLDLRILLRTVSVMVLLKGV